MTKGGVSPATVRVLPDVPALRREFDYAVPEAWIEDGRASRLRPGTMVRVALHGRRVGGWVTEVDPEPTAGVELIPLAKISGEGPPPNLIEMARWAAWRWAGPVASLLRTASPPRMVAGVGRAGPPDPPSPPDDELVREAFGGTGSVVRLPPLGDRWPLVMGAVSRGNALILTPSVSQAGKAVGRLRRLGVRVGLYDRDWATGASGATIVGTRAAAMAPVEGLASILVLDEHDEVYQEERAPTWHAREVVVERARRAGVPCVLVSPMPTVEARSTLRLLTVSRRDEREGWPLIRVVDPRDDDSARGGLWSAEVVRALRASDRALVVLNRKGRSRLLVCRSCDELAVCDVCDGALVDPGDGELRCRLGHRRPLVCDRCGGTGFKNLRIGVSRAAEELEALVREPVVEITAESEKDDAESSRFVVGTEAVLHRVDRADLVVFVDFDQELTAPRYRAGEEAMALLVRAARLVRSDGVVLVQSRQPAHPVLVGAATADLEHWASGEAARRELLRYPPFSSIAQVSGPGADELVAALGAPLGVEVMGPVDGSWLLRSESAATLADALASVDRPKERVRVAVDPARL
jgi:primosomal protein N' (replication factor Y)